MEAICDQCDKAFKIKPYRAATARFCSTACHSESRSNDLAAFYDKVAYTADCHLWQGALTRDGYGVFSYRGHSVRAHRWLYEQLFGPIPKGMQLNHTCDIRSCVNLTHLVLGTAADNTADAVSKRRMAHGERAHKSSLTENDIRAIRARVAAGERKSHIAREFGVTPTAIGYIVSGKNWRYVT